MQMRTFRSVALVCIILCTAVLLLSYRNGRNGYGNRHTTCSTCHRKSISCHVNSKVGVDTAMKLWRGSFHALLMQDTFKGCTYLDCIRCHPDLDKLQPAGASGTPSFPY